MTFLFLPVAGVLPHKPQVTDFRQWRDFSIPSSVWLFLMMTFQLLRVAFVFLTLSLLFLLVKKRRADLFRTALLYIIHRNHQKRAFRRGFLNRISFSERHRSLLEAHTNRILFLRVRHVYLNIRCKQFDV